MSRYWVELIVGPLVAVGILGVLIWLGKGRP